MKGNGFLPWGFVSAILHMMSQIDLVSHAIQISGQPHFGNLRESGNRRTRFGGMWNLLHRRLSSSPPLPRLHRIPQQKFTILVPMMVVHECVYNRAFLAVVVRPRTGSCCDMTDLGE